MSEYPAATAADPRYELVFAESLRAIEQQATRRDDLRGRATVLVTAGSIASAFLGAQALAGDRNFETATWVAASAFAAIVSLAVAVLIPRDDWYFVNSASDLLYDYVEADPPATIDEIHRDLALHYEANYDGNDKRLLWYSRAIRASCFLLLVEVVAWLVDLKGRG